MASTLKLRDFGAGVRLGLTLLCLVILGGSAVSGIYMRDHHANRDESEGFTLDDVRAHYHGIRSEAPLLAALESGHPDDLPQDQRDALIAWLTGDNVRADYDNFDLGENMPEEIIATSCLDCHDSSATGEGAYPQLSLRYFDDVMAVSTSRDINPVDEKILMASMHAHSLSLATMCIVTVLLVALSRAPKLVIGFLSSITGLGLLLDIGSWIPARSNDIFIYGIVGGGFLFQVGVALSLVIVIIDLWMPRGSRSES